MLTIKNITIVAVAVELALLLLLAVALQPTSREARGPAAAPPGFKGDFQNFTPFDPRRPLPDATIADADGEAVSFDEFRGQVVLLNFWATWCVPCKREMPALDRLQAAMGGADFQVVTVSVDRQGAAVAAPWLEENGLANLPLYVDAGSEALRAFGARGLPTTYIIDRAGRIAGMIEGAAEWDSPEARSLIAFYIEEGE